MKKTTHPIAKKPLKLGTAELTQDHMVGLGVLEYKYLPRIGEWVEIEDDDHVAHMYEVVIVAHSSIGAGADLYVRKVGRTADALHDVRLLKAPRQEER